MNPLWILAIASEMIHPYLRSILFGAILLCGKALPGQESQRVLSTTTISLGTRSVTYQRVEPPTQTDTPVVATTAATSAVSAASREEALARRNLLRPEFLSLSCTVHDTGVTTVRWWHNVKQCIRAGGGGKTRFDGGV